MKKKKKNKKTTAAARIKQKRRDGRQEHAVFCFFRLISAFLLLPTSLSTLLPFLVLQFFLSTPHLCEQNAHATAAASCHVLSCRYVIFLAICTLTCARAPHARRACLATTGPPLSLLTQHLFFLLLPLCLPPVPAVFLLSDIRLPSHFTIPPAAVSLSHAAVLFMYPYNVLRYGHLAAGLRR